MEGAEEDGAVGIRLISSCAAPVSLQVQGVLEVLSMNWHSEAATPMVRHPVPTNQIGE
jgi:hypothetical protein